MVSFYSPHVSKPIFVEPKKMDPAYISVVAISAGMAITGAAIITFVACVRRCPRPENNPTVVTVLEWKNTNSNTK